MVNWQPSSPFSYQVSEQRIIQDFVKQVRIINYWPLNKLGITDGKECNQKAFRIQWMQKYCMPFDRTSLSCDPAVVLCSTLISDFVNMFMADNTGEIAWWAKRMCECEANNTWHEWWLLLFGGLFGTSVRMCWLCFSSFSQKYAERAIHTVIYIMLRRGELEHRVQRKVLYRVKWSSHSSFVWLSFQNVMLIGRKLNWHAIVNPVPLCQEL